MSLRRMGALAGAIILVFASVATAFASDEQKPEIKIEKSANTLSLPFGGGEVIFTYAVTNPGNVDLGDIVVLDNKCDAPAYLSGDNNHDSKLQHGETWIYTCTGDVEVTTENTATAAGCPSGGDTHQPQTCATNPETGCAAFDRQVDGQSCVKATDKLTVEVSEFAIAIAKVASLTTLPFGGGSVTFTYTITNPGEHPLGDIEVTDDMCSPVAYVSGDANTDSILQTSETWVFTCTKSVTATQTNTATANGCQVKEDKSPSSRDWKPECVSDTAQATVTVSNTGGVGGVTSAPTLPPTSSIASGTASSDSITWIAIMLAILGAMTFIFTPRLSRRR